MEIGVVGISKAYAAGAAALDGVDLSVASGELLALLGPSGSGKTTLLRVIAGLETPERGRILFGGEDATDLSVQDRRVGFVFQHYALFRHLTVVENVAYGLKARPRAVRPARAEIGRRVEALLALVQLEGLGGRYPSQLSGGQRQRVALARALAVEPRVLLLDEPFGALDARVRKDLRRWLRAIHRETGQTTLFVTHDQDEALELADRVAVLNRGRIEQVGTPDDLADRPASPFVMEFLGETARLPAIHRDGRIWVGGGAVLPAEPGAPEGDVVLCLRPERLSIRPAGEATLTGTVCGLRRSVAGPVAEILVAGASGPIEIAVSGGLRVGETVSVAVSSARVFPAGQGFEGRARD